MGSDSRYWVRHYPAEAGDRVIPKLMAIAVLDNWDHRSGVFGRRNLDASFSQIFLSVFAATRAILTAADLARLDRDRIQVMALATHDLRSPVATIRVQADAMNGLSGKNEESRREIVAKTDAALLSIENLLFEWEHGQDDDEGKPLATRSDFERLSIPDIVGIMRDLHSEAEQNYGDHKFLLEDLSGSELGYYVAASKNLLRLALKNVLDNAVKFGRHSPMILRVSLGSDGGGSSSRLVKIAVKDHGLGIPSENLKNIFERGRQHSYSHREVTTGSRIGLSITKAILEGFGGRIWAESIVGKETTMHILLPLLEPRK
jgi:signal transduction histidine kinase